jgi:hypothetical protein
LLISVLFLLFQVPNGQLFLWRFARQARIRVRQLMGQFIKAFGLVRVAGIEPALMPSWLCAMNGKIRVVIGECA